MNAELKIFILVVLLVSSTVFGGGCGKDTDSENANQGTAGDSDLVVGPLQGNLAPDFDLKRLNGGTLKLSSLKGKAVMIDFWDTWCGPCRMAMPHLQEISETYGDDLVVVGVAMGREGEAKVKSFVKSNNLTFEFVLADQPEYKVMKDFGEVRSIPTTFLVDREGVIRKIWTGGMPKAEYEKAVKLVLGV